MPVYKNEKNGTWYAMIRYTDWTGAKKTKVSKRIHNKKRCAGVGTTVSASEESRY